jgi:hypothetical protein
MADLFPVLDVVLLERAMIRNTPRRPRAGSALEQFAFGPLA